jgi:integrase
MTDLIDDYQVYLRRKRRAAYTIDQYIGLLRRADRQLPEGVALAGLEELVDWIYVDGRSETTYAHYTTIIQGFGKWLVADGRTDFHWSDELPEAHADSAEIRPATEEEFAGIQDLDGRPMSRTQVIERGRYYLHRMGLDLSMHQLRKRFATKAYKDSGHDIRMVQKLLGHRWVSTTQKYLGVDSEDAIKVVTGL